jgi:hypothetical protein
MSTNPKLEFYRFSLNHKKEQVKTFKDFAIDELKGGKKITNDNVIKLCFNHFIKMLASDFAKDDKLKKKLSLEKKKGINIHIDKYPAFNLAKNTISGVINGGPYGRERIISNNDDENDSEKLGTNKTVLMYFYFFLYIPADHHEGCFIIHSNSNEETITILFRNFIANIFKGTNYNKPSPEVFCPQSFQDEFKKGAILQSMIFKTSIIDTIPNSKGVSDLFKSYDVKIEIIPKSKKILISEVTKFKDFISKKLFGTEKDSKKLTEFEETRLNIENDVTNKTKVFEWNKKDNEFVPVVYLDKRIAKKNEDGTPDFIELAELCKNIFNDEILKSIRPDLYAVKIK